MQSRHDETRRSFLKSALLASAPLLASGAGAQAAEQDAAGALSTGKDDRAQWLAIVQRVAEPVLEACSRQRLRATMPVECAKGEEAASRASTHLQAVGRLLCGLAPWLEAHESGDAAEEKLRQRYREWARMAIQHGCDPRSPDFLNFGTNQQSLVDAAFLALAIVRAPEQLWKRLDAATKQNLISALMATRAVQPPFDNWLLFTAMIEACLCQCGEAWDTVRVDYALREHEQWYLGDGIYGDGPRFHWDYYNSYVIQPFLLHVLDAVQGASGRWNALRKPVEERSRRYAAIQERLIGPKGTFPPIGRSLTYRFGALHHLAEMAQRGNLPDGVRPGQVRAALTAVMRRMIDAPGTFDAQGWLTIGFAGHQPSLGERYISTGSLYLCACAWLPLGLSPGDAFWSEPAAPWTQRKIWSGADVAADHALDD